MNVEIYQIKDEKHQINSLYFRYPESDSELFFSFFFVWKKGGKGEGKIY